MRYTSNQLIAAYEAKRAARGKPVQVTYNGNGTYTIKPVGVSVPYIVTASSLKNKINAL